MGNNIGAVIIMHKNHNNYGTSLQGFATIKVLDQLGQNYRIIRYNKKRTIRELRSSVPGLVRSGALQQYIDTIKRLIAQCGKSEYKQNVKKRTKIVNQFKTKFFEQKSDYYTGYNSVCDGSKNYDVIFVGSDQVWGPLSLYSRFYNLLFVDKSIPKFSYASSFGVSEIYPWQRSGTKEYLDSMDLIGVRETRGKEIVEELSVNNAKVVLDPTFLLTKNEWKKYISESNKKLNEPYILSYILGSRKDVRREIMDLGKRTGLKVVSFNHMDWYEPADDKFGNIQMWDADALDFVNLLSNAEYICTDSFHATVFSIIFNKKFLTFYRHLPTNKKCTNSRIDSLLECFALKNRLYVNDSFKQISKNINYDPINTKLNSLREDSMKFLIAGLNLSKN